MQSFLVKRDRPAGAPPGPAPDVSSAPSVSSSASSSAPSAADIADSDRYAAKKQKEHILDLSDSYIGPAKPVEVENMWFCRWPGEGDLEMFQATASVSLGLYKIFDEILVNAADQVVRTRTSSSAHITKNIQVTYDDATGAISVYNDGEGIPVVEHVEHKVMIPALIFSRLLTSGNYKKGEKRITGGRNGYGAKLTNIFSSEFTVETVDASRGLKYKQTWRDNMSDPLRPAKITAYKSKPFTRITFVPDFVRFRDDDGAVHGLTEHEHALLLKRVVDVSGCTPPDVKVTWNGRRVPCKTLPAYAKLFVPDGTKTVAESPNERWDVVVAPSPDGSFRQMSFVNGVWTMHGGKHVDHVSAAIAKHVAALLNAKSAKSASTVQSTHVRNGMWLFLCCSIENPSFTSQTKESMSTSSRDFGSRCVLSEAFYERVSKTDVARQAQLLRDFHTRAVVSRSDGRRVSKITGIPKLEDANWAGTKRSPECTLVVTEGDSAKAMVMSGISVVGTDRYGVYPLRGKINNLFGCSEATADSKSTIRDLKKILGLQTGGNSADLSKLRYGRLMVMTDQDHDGSHIKALLLNLFGSFWEDFLREGRMVTLITPLVRIKRGRDDVAEFYSKREFEEWRDRTVAAEGSTKAYSVKYYKGLGTSTKSEAKHYFSEPRLMTFTFTGTHDDPDHEALALAFDKARANQRKQWLEEVNEQPPDYFERPSVSVHDFVHNELIHFSAADNVRSLPCAFDGFKPTQRKVVWGCLVRNQTKEIKVSQLIGPLSTMTAYHHGEGSMGGTLVNLAQNYVGANNVNFMVPLGQYGTRLRGGKDASQDRYIFTRLEPVTRALHPVADDPLWVQREEDGEKIEPVYLLPVVPTLLLNGACGIGTGYSVSVPPHNPSQVADAVEVLLDQIANDQDLAPPDLVPWFRKFKGSVIPSEDRTKFSTQGVWEVTGKTTLRITELPVGVWTTDYKRHLSWLMGEDEDDAAANKTAKTTKTTTKKRKRKKIDEPLLTKVTTGNTTHDDEHVDFRVTFAKPYELTPELLGTLKLVSSGDYTTSNMHCFDPFGKITRMDSVGDILKRFVCFRLPFYVARRDYMIRVLKRSLSVLENKWRFVNEVMAGDVVVFRVSDDALLETLVSRGFQPMREEDHVVPVLPPEDLLRRCWDADPSGGEWVPEAPVLCTESRSPTTLRDYKYLLGMQVRTFTAKRLKDLQDELETERKKLGVIEAKSPVDLWREDLATFRAAWGDMLKVDAAGGP